ncbi:hypothetical protein ACFXAZ_25915 [Streptomyces sp. NPDC059477]|uniref:hypothetical protein n=1 Tax=Streptomyces sp. NPDC059477 TaxID=3346847 RepID=UPI00367725AD
MTGTGWERVGVDEQYTAAQTAYLAYGDHCRSCLVCAADSETCAVAQALWEAYTARAETSL